jgi:glutathione S-transferase
MDAEELDLLGGENRAESYLKKNPRGAMSALELDDDTLNLSAWFEHMDARPSANASKHSAAEQIALDISEMVPSLLAVAGPVSVT